jgi:hypothetical protein
MRATEARRFHPSGQRNQMPEKIFLLALVATCVLLTVSQSVAQTDTRVQFPPGLNTVTLKGMVGEANHDYVLRAGAGQRLIVRLTSANPQGRFSLFQTDYGVRYEGMEDPLEGAKEVTRWDGALPKAGDYHVYVISPNRDPMAFTLEVTLQDARVSAADFEGWFELQGKAPKGIEGFEGVELTTVDFKSDGTTVPVKPSGKLRAHGVIKITSIVIDGANLSFETAVVRGVSYGFAGSLHNGTASDPQARVIEGHLTKTFNGSTIAEAQVRLLYVEGVD